MKKATKGCESDLVQVFLITECTGVHEPPLVSILAVLQRFVVAVFFAAHRAHVSMIFIKMKIILMKSSTNFFFKVFDEENIPGLSTMYDCNMVLKVKDIHIHYIV